MRSRGLVVAVAVVLAVVAAGAVFLYTNGVRQNAESGGTLVPVVTSSVDIAANTNLNPLIEAGAFGQVQVPEGTVVDGAVTSLEQLRGRTTTSAILANEQIPSSRLSGGEALPGGALGISPGHVGTAVQVEDYQGVAGHVSRGDYVAVYVTFDGGALIAKKPLKAALAPQQFTQLLEAASGGSGTTAATVAQAPVVGFNEPITVTLVPGVRVLDVVNPVVDEATGRKNDELVTMTLDLLPEDSQALAYSASLAQSSKATLWFGLLPPESQDGYPVEATIGPQFEQVIGSAK
jgi:Flp pilus assembly protein CpaB